VNYKYGNRTGKESKSTISVAQTKLVNYTLQPCWKYSMLEQRLEFGLFNLKLLGYNWFQTLKNVPQGSKWFFV